MVNEDSTATKLSELFPNEDEECASLNTEKACEIQVTREELDEITNLYRLNPNLAESYNFIIETRSSGTKILHDMNLFTFSDGEGKRELSEFEKRMLNANNDNYTERHIISIMGKRADDEAKFT